LFGEEIKIVIYYVKNDISIFLHRLIGNTMTVHNVINPSLFIKEVQDHYLDNVLPDLEFTEQLFYFLSASVPSDNTGTGSLFPPATADNYEEVSRTWPDHVQEMVRTFFSTNQPDTTKLLIQIETQEDGVFHLKEYKFTDGELVRAA
jgi:hypothetical protein